MDLDVVGDYSFWAPPDGFPFRGGDIRAEDLVSVSDISRHDREIYYHAGTHHVVEVPLRQVPHESQGATCGLGPLVLPTGETFVILCHHVDYHDGVAHGVIIRLM